MISVHPKLAPKLRSISFRLGAIDGAWALVALGALLRLRHFLRFPSVWHDEAAVVLNAINLEMGQMVGPLLYHEAAPPLFLMAERLMFLFFGDSLLAFRALSLAASCLALVLVALLSARVLPRPAALWAIALFATSDRLLYHATEAKPYSLDVLVAAAVAFGYVCARHWPIWRQCLAALPLLPVLLWWSFPSCFVVGGWFICQLPALWRRGSRYDWAAAAALAVAVAASLLALVLGPVHAQRDAAMESCWTSGFPDWRRPWLVPVWFVRSTLDIFSYCLSPQGWALAGFIAVGAFRFWRSPPEEIAEKSPGVSLRTPGMALQSPEVRRLGFHCLGGAIPGVRRLTPGLSLLGLCLPRPQFAFFQESPERGLERNLLVLFTAPLALVLVAALMGAYPYCGLRVLAFMTPAICILAAAGIAPLLAWARCRSRLVLWLLWAALAIPFMHTGLRVAVPWGRADTGGSAAYVLERWQPGDGIGFNHWEGDYYFRGRTAAWAKGTPPETGSANRLWYVAVAPGPSLREAVLRTIPLEWRPVERMEFAGATVVLFVRDRLEPTSTSALSLIP